MKRNYLMVALIMLTFFVISLITNIIGPLIPDIIKGFNLSLTLVALLPFSFFFAYGVMSIPTGILILKHSEKQIMLLAFMIALSGALLLALKPDYYTAIISLFLIGCGMAMLQVVINPMLRTAGGEEQYAFNSVLAQLIFGSASFVSPLLYSSMIIHFKSNGNSVLLNSIKAWVPSSLPWISLYWLFAVVCIGMIVIISLLKFPQVALSKEETAGPVKTHTGLLKQRVVIVYFLAIFCYVGTEQGIANWLSQFLFTYHGYDPQTTGANIVAYFWGLMTAGGVLGLLLLKVMDSRKVLILFTTLALATLTMALFASGKISLVAFPLVGFFASVMYPIIFSLALNSVKEHHGSLSGILVTGIIGGAVIPLIIGWLGDQLGLRPGMMFLYITMGFIFFIGFWARPILTNKTIRLSKKSISSL